MQYFRPSISYHLSLRPLFCLFLSGHFRQVLLYHSLKVCVQLTNVAKCLDFGLNLQMCECSVETLQICSPLWDIVGICSLKGTFFVLPKGIFI